VTTHDVLIAYIILTLNIHCFSTDEERILHTSTVVNYRGVSDSLTPKGYAGNSIISLLSSDFPNPLSLSSIAKTIRQTIKVVRSEDFLKKWTISADILYRQLLKDDRVTFIQNKNAVVLNSNFKYDWANQVNFGMINQCRFHTGKSHNFRCRIFRLNPIRGEDGHWTRDNGGAEVTFRIPKGEGKEKILEAWKKDIKENFVNVK